MALSSEHKHDPGGKVRIKLADDVRSEARFSECGRYRQMISRDWTPEGATPRTVLFIGQNPSVAGAEVDDPTVQREQGFARRWGYTRFLKGNIIDWRATSPRDVPKDIEEAVSAQNMPELERMAKEAEIVVLAWGALHRRYDALERETVARLRKIHPELYCLGLTRAGSPRHPLYLAKATERIVFPGKP